MGSLVARATLGFEGSSSRGRATLSPWGDIEAEASESGSSRQNRWALEAVRRFFLCLRLGRRLPTGRVCASSCPEDISEMDRLARDLLGRNGDSGTE